MNTVKLSHSFDPETSSVSRTPATTYTTISQLNQDIILLGSFVDTVPQAKTYRTFLNTHRNRLKEHENYIKTEYPSVLKQCIHSAHIRPNIQVNHDPSVPNVTNESVSLTHTSDQDSSYCPLTNDTRFSHRYSEGYTQDKKNFSKHSSKTDIIRDPKKIEWHSTKNSTDHNFHSTPLGRLANLEFEEMQRPVWTRRWSAWIEPSWKKPEKTVVSPYRYPVTSNKNNELSSTEKNSSEEATSSETSEIDQNKQIEIPIHRQLTINPTYTPQPLHSLLKDDLPSSMIPTNQLPPSNKIKSTTKKKKTTINEDSITTYPKCSSISELTQEKTPNDYPIYNMSSKSQPQTHPSIEKPHEMSPGTIADFVDHKNQNDLDSTTTASSQTPIIELNDYDGSAEFKFKKIRHHRLGRASTIDEAGTVTPSSCDLNRKPMYSLNTLSTATTIHDSIKENDTSSAKKISEQQSWENRNAFQAAIWSDVETDLEIIPDCGIDTDTDYEGRPATRCLILDPFDGMPHPFWGVEAEQSSWVSVPNPCKIDPECKVLRMLILLKEDARPKYNSSLLIRHYKPFLKYGIYPDALFELWGRDKDDKNYTQHELEQRAALCKLENYPFSFPECSLTRDSSLGTTTTPDEQRKIVQKRREVDIKWIRKQAYEFRQKGVPCLFPNEATFKALLDERERMHDINIPCPVDPTWRNVYSSRARILRRPRKRTIASFFCEEGDESEAPSFGEHSAESDSPYSLQPSHLHAYTNDKLMHTTSSNDINDEENNQSINMSDIQNQWDIFRCSFDKLPNGTQNTPYPIQTGCKPLIENNVFIHDQQFTPDSLFWDNTVTGVTTQVDPIQVKQWPMLTKHFQCFKSLSPMHTSSCLSIHSLEKNKMKHNKHQRRRPHEALCLKRAFSSGSIEHIPHRSCWQKHQQPLTFIHRGSKRGALKVINEQDNLELLFEEQRTKRGGKILHATFHSKMQFHPSDNNNNKIILSHLHCDNIDNAIVKNISQQIDFNYFKQLGQKDLPTIDGPLASFSAADIVLCQTHLVFAYEQLANLRYADPNKWNQKRNELLQFRTRLKERKKLRARRGRRIFVYEKEVLREGDAWARFHQLRDIRTLTNWPCLPPPPVPVPASLCFSNDGSGRNTLPWPTFIPTIFRGPGRYEDFQESLLHTLWSMRNTNKILPPSQQVDLKLWIGGFMIPHDDKRFRYGDDAWFGSETLMCFGVCDGVGEMSDTDWRVAGFDCRGFGEDILREAKGRIHTVRSSNGQQLSCTQPRMVLPPHCKRSDKMWNYISFDVASNSSTPSLIALDAMISGYYGKTTSWGAATCLIGCLNDSGNKIGFANIGDSRAAILRRDNFCTGPLNFVGSTEPEQHGWNLPVQVARLPERGRINLMRRDPRLQQLVKTLDACRATGQDISDPVETAILSDFDLQEGDLILLASDGLWDNVFDAEIAAFCGISLSPKESRWMTDSVFMSTAPRDIAKGLCLAAYWKSLQHNADTPFSRSVKEAGGMGRSLGGKPDDITVVAAWVVPETDQNDNALLLRCQSERQLRHCNIELELNKHSHHLINTPTEPCSTSSMTDTLSK